MPLSHKIIIFALSRKISGRDYGEWLSLMPRHENNLKKPSFNFPLGFTASIVIVILR